MSLKQIRNRLELSRREVEQQLNLRSMILKDYETGRLKLPMAHALVLSKFYGVTLYQLIGEQEPQIQNVLVRLLGTFSDGHNQQESIFSTIEKKEFMVHQLYNLMLADLRITFEEERFYELLKSQLGVSYKKHLKYQPRFTAYELELVIKLLFELASADGQIVPEELDFIKSLSVSLKFPVKRLEAITDIYKGYLR